MSRLSKMHVIALALGLSAMFSSAAIAQAAAATTPASPANTPAGANSTKIGIVNIQDAIVATNEGKM